MRDNPPAHRKSFRDTLIEMGHLMKECHRESLALQDAVSTAISDPTSRRIPFEALQSLDHLTQIHDDLARLLPLLADTVGDAGPAVPPEAATALRLRSLRRRLVGESGRVRTSSPGDVSIF